MKMALKVLGVVLVVIVGVLGWMGVLSPVNVAESEMGPYPFVYVQEATADPKRIGELSTALAKRLDAAGFTDRKPAQVYFPAGGAQNQIGFVVNGTVGVEVLGADTFFRSIPQQRYAVVKFPFRNRLSFIAGAMRVEPALHEHINRKQHSDSGAIVILDGNTILYLEPLVS